MTTATEEKSPKGSYIKLRTGDNRFIVTVLVPPMRQMPEVLTWGVFTFLRVDDQTYREVVSYRCHTASEMEVWT